MDLSLRIVSLFSSAVAVFFHRFFTLTGPPIPQLEISTMKFQNIGESEIK